MSEEVIIPNQTIYNLSINQIPGGGNIAYASSQPAIIRTITNGVRQLRTTTTVSPPITALNPKTGKRGYVYYKASWSLTPDGAPTKKGDLVVLSSDANPTRSQSTFEILKKPITAAEELSLNEEGILENDDRLSEN